MGVYLDETTKKRFNKAIRKEQDKEIERDGVATISKSNFCEGFTLLKLLYAVNIEIS